MFLLYLAFPFILGFVLLILYSLYIIYIRYIKYGHIPRGPIPSFFLGHAAMLINTSDDWREKIRFWGEWCDDHGGFVAFFVLHSVIMLTDNHSIAKEVMTSRKFPKNKTRGYRELINVFGSRFAGNGLVTDVDHDHWYRKRQLLNPAFHRLALKELMDEFNLGGDNMLAKLLDAADGKTVVSMLDIVNRTALDVIGRTAFGLDIDSLNNDKSPFPTSIRLVLRGITTSYKEPFAEYNPWKRTYINDVKNATVFLRDFARKVIQERLALVEDNVDLPNDVLTNILKSTMVDSSVTLEELVDDFLTFFIAGQETTANSMAFFLFEAGKRPEILTRLVEEVDEVLGNKKYIEYDDLAKLEYMNLVIKETLRLFPVAAGTIRETTEEDTTLGGFQLPVGTPILVSFGNIHRKECYFKDPLEFKPERFNDENQREFFTYMPFSAGMRNCIGQNFAMIESRVVLAKFLQTFKYSLLPNQSDKVTEATTIKPSSGVMATLLLRES